MCATNTPSTPVSDAIRSKSAMSVCVTPLPIVWLAEVGSM
jgi:hypothetical protein